ncbi:extracellular solute-binding protein [Sandaracinus amylolyticus]|uniref:extracellular solute-binding protein n=1 Tax=Sandaracinus amylolyticus TaxID=927083 RepID=UPI001F47D530|nr:extracellular solute-binding protein [Sandaracinus amylolyticus]UJR81736.1 Maltose transport system permease protein MalF [Sandaracinus amylolyticus]
MSWRRTQTRAVLSAALTAALALIAGVTLTWVSSARGQTTTITLWHSYGEREERGLRAAVDAFEQRHRGTRVEMLAVPFGAYASKLESAIPVQRGPDVFVDAHDRLSSYVSSHLVQPLGAELDRSLRAGAELERAHLDALTIDGALYGVPLQLKSAALFVNDALLGDRTIESLEDLEALRATLPEGSFPLAWDADDAYQFASLLHAYGGGLLEPDGTYAFVGPRTERALDHLLRLLRTRTIPEETSYELVRDLFRSGRAATAISGPWFASDLPTDLQWSVRPLPIVRGADGEPMRAFATIEAAFVAEGARDLDAARSLAVFLATPEAARLRAIHGGHVVATRSVWSDPEVARDTRLVAFREAASHARITPTHPNMRAVFVPAERALRNVLRGEIVIDEALAQGQHRFDDETREPPAPRDPSTGLLAFGLVLLAMVFSMVRRARDPMFRVALRRSMPAYAWVAHAAITVGILVILPLVVGAGTSFFAGHGRDLHYVGLSNYVDIITVRGGDLLGHGSFWAVLVVTVLWTAANISLHVAIGVALALLLNRSTLRFKGLYRVLLVLPWAVPSYVTALAWRGMFHRQFGAVNAMLEALGAPPISWFARWSTAFAANVTTNVWLGFPFMMVVTLGALTAIPKDLYEAAEVDGATRWQQFRFVTLPLLRPSLAPAVAMGAVWTFNMFNVVYLVSAGEPDGTTEILVSEAYRWAFTRGHQYGYAAAYAVLIFLLLYFGTRALPGSGSAKEGAR